MKYENLALILIRNTHVRSLNLTNLTLLELRTLILKVL